MVKADSGRIAWFLALRQLWQRPGYPIAPRPSGRSGRDRVTLAAETVPKGSPASMRQEVTSASTDRLLAPRLPPQGGRTYVSGSSDAASGRQFAVGLPRTHYRVSGTQPRGAMPHVRMTPPVDPTYSNLGTVDKDQASTLGTLRHRPINSFDPQRAAARLPHLAPAHGGIRVQAVPEVPSSTTSMPSRAQSRGVPSDKHPIGPDEPTSFTQAAVD